MAFRKYWFVLLILAGLAVVLATGSLSDGGRKQITVRSNPSGASVFGGEGLIGVTPLQLLLSSGESRNLLLIKRGLQDQKVIISNSEGQPQEYVFDLAAIADAAVTITSEPSGADVFLDGSRVGKTPIAIDGLSPGTANLRLEHPDCYAEQEIIILQSGEETTVHKEMKDKVVAFYEELIAKEPVKLTHYCELAHHNLLRGRHEEAAKALERGFEAWKAGGAQEANRYVDELLHIYTRYFIYPKEPEGHRLRPLCRELMERAVQEKIGNRDSMNNYLRQMDNYDKRD